MKRIENLHEINGGAVSTVIGGLCAATLVARLGGFFSPAAPVAIGWAAVCVVNGFAASEGWW